MPSRQIARDYDVRNKPTNTNPVPFFTFSETSKIDLPTTICHEFIMQITAFTDYSLRVLIYLAVSDGRQVSSREIAESYGISVHHVAKVSKWLVREGYAAAMRGKGGGLTLARAPDDIKIGEIVRRAERGTGLVECMRDSPQGCAIEAACGLIGILNQANRAFFDTLDRHSLADATVNKAGIAKLLQQIKVDTRTLP